MMSDQVVYLEKFVESTVSMPSELTRLLNMIRDLDHKTEGKCELSAKVEEQCATVLAMPSGKAHAEQVKEKMQKIKNDQSLLIQWAEEKVQLAVTGHQLLEKYAHALDGDIANLTQYLTDTGQLVDEYMPDEYGVNHEPHLYDNVTSRRAGSSRPGYTSSIDGAVEMQEQIPETQQITRKTTIPLTIPKKQSNLASEVTSTQVADDSTKRRRGNDARRRSASANVQATTAVVAALYDEDEYAEGKHASDLAMVGAIPFEPFIPGLNECAKKPQAARRRLTENDISPSLVGKIAEVYWVADNPEESLWYLVKVESIDMAAKTACVRYQNGEIEADLNLPEVAKDGHMLLV